ncbi:hypothetical protein ACHAWF_002099 [Thalassiosira exigua]
MSNAMLKRRRSSGASSRVPKVVQPVTVQPSASAPSVPSTYTAALKGSLGGDNNGKPRNQSAQKSLAHALLPDLPLLMHGSGDVLPENVDPRSVATLAKLVEKYVASLVGAAMDAHDVFTDGEVVGGGAVLGAPPYAASAGGESDEDEFNVGGQKERPSRKKKRKRIDYWDVPIPPPAEDNDGDDSDLSEEDSEDDAPLLSPFRRLSSLASASTITKETAKEIQCFAPVDLHASERTRSYYVSAPTVMDARSFIFPICHDAVLYQRIKEVQASRRAILRDVVDDTMMDMMKEEGVTIGRWGTVDMLDAVLQGGANGESNEILSDKLKGNIAKKTNDKAKGTDTKKDVKASAEKKGEKIDATRVVGAGLLDPDVDPSWPDLNALSRGSVIW